MKPEIQITESAQDYLAYIAKQEGNPELRIGVSNPGTSLSQCFITFKSEPLDQDVILDFEGFSLSYEERLAQFIDEMSVHYSKNRLGGKLKIKAPNIKVVQEVPQDADLMLKVTFVLEQYVNPVLAEHQGGVVADRTEGNKVFLKFGGNCLGCGNAEKTLTEFVETTLKEHLPEIEAVSQVTKH